MRKPPPQDPGPTTYDPVQARRWGWRKQMSQATLFSSILFLSKGWKSNPRSWMTPSDPSALSSSEGAVVVQESGRPAPARDVRSPPLCSTQPGLQTAGESKGVKMLLGLMGGQGPTCLRGDGLLTHSKCFLIFSDSAYLEIPLMKRVRLTCGGGQQACLPAGGLQESHRTQGGGLGLVGICQVSVEYV